MTAKHCILRLALAGACATWTLAQERFDSAEDAAQAVIAAAERHDAAKLAAIFGPQGKEILTSGDAGQDQAEQTEFSRLADAKHSIQVSPANPNRAILVIGDEDWPFPVPMIRANGKWSFNASAAPAEMHARRIGADELDAIEICYGYVDAQRRFASEDRDHDGLLEYAPRLMSSPGKQDGLYWKDGGSPLIPEAFAMAAWDGGQKGNARPYHGYYFRVLDGQGPNARGGQHSYLAKNKMIGGFGLVAWPADYGASGIHTFIVNQDGVVYQKDIAPPPGKAAPPPISRFDPDPSWEAAE